MTLNYKIVLIRDEDEGGFAVSCPALPGCWSQGETEQEAIENIKDAIREYLAVVAERTPEGEIREVQVDIDEPEAARHSS